jgi:tRNA-splicing ligase RtcB
MESLEDGKVVSWATNLEKEAEQQAIRTASMPFVVKPLALMPDAHLGIGATVGSVIATEGAIIPSAVGVDIGCGMIAVETDIFADGLPDDIDKLHTGWNTP